MATVRRTRVSEAPDAVPAGAAVPDETAHAQYDRATERRWALDASDIVTLLVGIFYGVMGLLALIELGLADYPSEATTEVFGLAQTQIWGTIGLGLGLLLLIGVGGYGRSVSTFAGALLLVVGIVVVAALDEFDAVLATERAYGWVAIILGAIVLIAAIAVPTVTARSERVVEDV